MAIVKPNITQLDDRDGSVLKYEWTLTGTDDGAPIPMTQWADRTVHMTGTWGGGTVVFEGGNQGVAGDYQTLTDVQTVAIIKTANSLEQVAEITEWARPRATVAVGSVLVTLVARRQNPMRT
jgi:hypothetical protein